MHNPEHKLYRLVPLVKQVKERNRAAARSGRAKQVAISLQVRPGLRFAVLSRDGRIARNVVPFQSYWCLKCKYSSSYDKLSDDARIFRHLAVYFRDLSVFLALPSPDSALNFLETLLWHSETTGPVTVFKTSTTTTRALRRDAHVSHQQRNDLLRRFWQHVDH